MTVKYNNSGGVIMLQTYNGVSLGKNTTFDYDDEQFEMQNPGQLHYIGDETDGSNITVPNGLIDGSNLFRETAISSPAMLPNSIEKMEATYAGCQQLADPGIVPPNVTNIRMAWAHSGIESAPELPDGVQYADFAFDHCENLQEFEKFPESLQSADCMFSGDTNLTTLPDAFPENVESIKGFAAGCENLQNVPVANENMKHMDNAYAYCDIDSVPYVPEGCTCEGFTEGCANLDEQSANDIETTPLDREAALAELEASLDQSSPETESSFSMN